MDIVTGVAIMSKMAQQTIQMTRTKMKLNLVGLNERTPGMNNGGAAGCVVDIATSNGLATVEVFTVSK